MQVSLQHIHIVTENKFQLAKWYCDNLGFEVLGDIEAMGESEGPIFISGDGGKTALSLFNKKARHKVIGTNCIPAFELEPEDFIRLYTIFKDNENNLEIFYNSSKNNLVVNNFEKCSEIAKNSEKTRFIFKILYK